MKLARYVLKNVFRNKKRTALTVLSIGFSIFLLIALWTVMDMMNNPPENDISIRRVATYSKTSLAQMLPVGYAERIKKVPHVERVMLTQWFGGWWREEKNFVGALATDHNEFFEVFKDYSVEPAVRQMYLADKRSAIVGGSLLKRFGWKVGDSITIHGMIFSTKCEMTIVGSYTHPVEENMIFFRWDYLNEVLGDSGQISSFWLLADSPNNVPAVCSAIDALFDSSDAKTRTETEKAFRLSFVNMLGNITLIIQLIAGVVVFTMLLVTASTMAMTIRERTREVAILKAIGYNARRILALIVGESLALAFLGWSFAFAISVWLQNVDTDGPTQGFVPSFNPTLPIYLASVAVCLSIGAVSGLLPGWQASRLTIAESMRKLE